ncbi:hypothetical protein C7S18_16780 [Ahniella affigens]|uniref:DUF1800 domain-containing protein n=1 Tax=Ahniella affigens TaxID=2021234 RepID=A0A2P1PV64_9GAMM|nr:DUF1800 domain-containing protein [Ahniella affigens]AVP98741.1 hypothetical protein C7S18_16780 [Ahniella affigens]
MDINIGTLQFSEAKQLDASLPLPGDLLHLLNRTTFGPTEADVVIASQLGFDGWLNQQLNFAELDDSAVENVIRTALPTTTWTNLQLIEDARLDGRGAVAVAELRAAAYIRQIFSPRQLYEIMVEFWTNHFNIEQVDGPLRQFKTVDDREVVRKHAMGRFVDLLKSSARSPAMLYYLDNYANVATGPNENYARELMELHTLGVDGGYTEDDVKAVARILTGWSFNTSTTGGADIRFLFRSLAHDFTAKVALGQDYPAGVGESEGDLLLERLAAHPSTAQFISRKLARRFVSDNPPQTLVDAMAASFLSSQGHIPTVLSVMFRSAEFRASADNKMKRPAEYVNAVIRVLGARLGNQFYRVVTEVLSELNQIPFNWPAPNGYPDVQGYWTNTSSVLTRWNFAIATVEGQFGAAIEVSMSRLLPVSVQTPAQIVDALTTRLLRRSLAPADREQLINLVAGSAPVDRPVKSSVRMAAIIEVSALLLASPYFQYR